MKRILKRAAAEILRLKKLMCKRELREIEIKSPLLKQNSILRGCVGDLIKVSNKIPHWPEVKGKEEGCNFCKTIKNAKEVLITKNEN